jgi:hypothetical protein
MDLDDFIAKRRADITRQISALQMELAKLDAAEQAAARIRVGWGIEQAPSTSQMRQPAKGRPIRAGSIKDWILKALNVRPGGLETEEVITQVGLLGGPDVPRNSMTPQLSRLKQAGWIVQVGRLWMLPGNAPADPQPDLDMDLHPPAPAAKEEEPWGV